jgi:hypothetical protein
VVHLAESTSSSEYFEEVSLTLSYVRLNKTANRKAPKMFDTLVDREDLIRQGFRSHYITHLLGPGVKDEAGKEWWSQLAVNNTIRTVVLPAYATSLMVDHKRIWNVDFDANAIERWETIREASAQFGLQDGPADRPLDAQQDEKDQELADANAASDPLLNALREASGE